MRKFTPTEVVQLLAAVASIASGIGLLIEGPPARSAIILIPALVVVAVASLLLVRERAVRVGRAAMVRTGRSLIEGAKESVTMFARDMSWANEYAEVIKAAVRQGKDVRVLFPASDAEQVKANADLLLSAGASLLQTKFDSGLRAMLVDGDDPSDAFLFLVNRRLRHGAPPVARGQRGSEENYEYQARIFRLPADVVLIRAVRKIEDVLTDTATRR